MSYQRLPASYGMPSAGAPVSMMASPSMRFGGGVPQYAQAQQVRVSQAPTYAAPQAARPTYMQPGRAMPAFSAQPAVHYAAAPQQYAAAPRPVYGHAVAHAAPTYAAAPRVMQLQPQAVMHIQPQVVMQAPQYHVHRPVQYATASLQPAIISQPAVESEHMPIEQEHNIQMEQTTWSTTQEVREEAHQVQQEVHQEQYQAEEVQVQYQEDIQQTYDAPAAEEEQLQQDVEQDQLINDAAQEAAQPQSFEDGMPVKLQVSLNHALGLTPETFPEETGNMWCQCEIMGTATKVSTQIVAKTLEPVWNETYELDWHVGQPLVFSLYHEGRQTEGNPTEVSSEQFFPNGLEGDLPLEGLEGVFMNIRVVPLIDGGGGGAEEAAPQANVKQQIGDWLICEDGQGEFYSHQPTGQTYDQPPPELLQLIEQMEPGADAQ